MTDQHDNHGEQSSQARRGSLVANWPLLLVAVLGLLAVVAMPRQDQDKVRDQTRKLVPAVPGTASPTANGEADTGGYQARYEAEKVYRDALQERLYGRKYQRYTEIEAEVVKRNPYTGYYTGDLLLGCGSRDGVRAGLIVVNRDFVAVGRVVAVDRATCTLRLVTNPELIMSVRIPARDLSGITGVAEAVGTTGQVALLLPPPSLFVTAIQADEMDGTGRTRDQRDPQFLKPGDVVVTNGESDPENCTDGIVVGRISHTAPPETNTSGWPLKAWIIPGRLDSLRYVKILVPPRALSTTANPSAN